MFRVYVGNPAVKIGFNEAPPRPTGSLHTIELKDCHSLASHAVPEILIDCVVEIPCIPMIVIEDPPEVGASTYITLLGLPAEYVNSDSDVPALSPTVTIVRKPTRPTAYCPFKSGLPCTVVSRYVRSCNSSSSIQFIQVEEGAERHEGGMMNVSCTEKARYVLYRYGTIGASPAQNIPSELSSAETLDSIRPPTSICRNADGPT